MIIFKVNNKALAEIQDPRKPTLTPKQQLEVTYSFQMFIYSFITDRFFDVRAFILSGCIIKNKRERLYRTWIEFCDHF